MLTSYLTTIQSERAKSKNTQEMSCSPDSETGTCQTSQYGMMSAHSTGDLGGDQLTFFAEDSPAKTSLRRVKEQELPESVLDYGRNMRDSLERCGLDLSLPKTHLCFALGDLELSSKTWPRWGIMLDGELSELGMSVRHIKETEGGSWPTPMRCSAMAATHTPESAHNPKRLPNLETVVGRRTWPTPTTMDKLPPKSPEALHREATVARPGRSRPANLRDCVHPSQMMKWPTPCTRDYKGINSQEGLTRKDGKSRMDQLPNAVAYGGTQTQQKWPTPQSRDYKDTINSKPNKQKHLMDEVRKNIPNAVAYGGTQIQQTYPTPRCFMHKDALTDRGKSNLGEVINEKEKMAKTGQLNPSWVEWLMGWPVGWTDLKPLVTDKFRNVQLWHSVFSQKD